jgi:hypothetical protein
MMIVSAEIVKVQVPVASIDPDWPALVYAKGRSRMVETPITPEIETAMDGKPKRFFWAEWLGGVIGWKIDWSRRAPWQNW